MPNVPTTNVGLSAHIRVAAGGANPTALSEYYAGSDYVVDHGVATAAGDYGAIPASGSISIGDFRNKFFFKATISANRTSTYNVMTEAQAAGFVPASQTLIAIITINSGIYVVGSSAGAANYAFDTGTGYTKGATIHLINNGIIAGRGGAGGAGGSSGNGGAGGQGGSALRTQLGSGGLRITNNGTIAAGGGGGGGGGGYFDGKTYYQGGGGGGGRSLGAAGGGTPNGAAGTTTAAGGGGNGTYADGGSGAAYGGTGGSGQSPFYSGGAGGGPGNCTNGNANITWIATGTRIGTLG